MRVNHHPPDYKALGVTLGFQCKGTRASAEDGRRLAEGCKGMIT